MMPAGSDPELDPASFAAGLAAKFRGSRFVRDVASLWSAQAVVAVGAALQGVIVARVLGPSSYGVAGLIAAFPAFVYVFFDARSADAGMRYLGEFAATGRHPEARAFCKLGYLIDLGVGLASLAVVVLLAPWAAAKFVHDPGAAGYVVVFAAGMMLRTPAVTSEAALITLGHAKRVASLQVSMVIVRAALVLASLLAGLGVPGVIWATAIGFALEGAASAVVAWRAVRSGWGAGWIGQSLVPLRARRREIARFLIWADLGSTIGLAAKQLDVLAVGWFLSPLAAGYYRLAVSLGSIGGVAVGPLQSVMYQRFARLRGSADLDGLRDTVRRSIRHVCAPLALLGLLTLPLVPLAIRLTAGAAYLPAAGATQIIVLSSIVWMLLAWVRPLALTMDEVRAWTGFGLASATVATAGYLVVTPAYGFAGTAWVRLAAAAVNLGLAAWFLERRYLRTGFASVRSSP